MQYYLELGVEIASPARVCQETLIKRPFKLSELALIGAVMKRTELAPSLILLLVLTITGTKLDSLGGVNAQENQSQIMSFEEAIEFANIEKYSGEQLFSYGLTGESKGQVFVDGEGITGFLMWIAPNGTIYEAEYPSGITLGELGHTGREHNWNPPDGYYLWNIYNGEGLWKEKYWIFANNGTVALYTPPRGGGPTSAPPPYPQEIIYGAALAVLIAIVGIGLLLYFKKRKH